MSGADRRKPLRSREAYRYFHTLQTRWQDNDVYGHINNASYYGFIDTAVNRFLIDGGFLDWQNDPVPSNKNAAQLPMNCAEGWIGSWAMIVGLLTSMTLKRDAGHV
jgi:hypothetical protein